MASATGSSSKRRRRSPPASPPRHVVLPLDLRAFGGSALTDDIAVPKDGGGRRHPGHLRPGAQHHLPQPLRSAWPRRAARATSIIGVNALDYSGYPDCRPEFVAAFEALANQATKAGVEGDGFTLHAPLIAMTKADIAREAARLGLDAGISHSLLRPAARRAPLRPLRGLPAARQGLRRGGARPTRRAYA